MQRRPLNHLSFPYTTLFRSWTDFSGALSTCQARANRIPLRVRDMSGTKPSWLEAKSSAREGPNSQVGSVLAQLLDGYIVRRSEEHTSELQSRRDLVCRLLLE